MRIGKRIDLCTIVELKKIVTMKNTINSVL